MEFDPDAYLADKAKAAPAAPVAFDPDAYLASKAPAPAREPSWYDKAKTFVTGEKFDPKEKPGIVQDIVQSAPGAFAKASSGLLGAVDFARNFGKTPEHAPSTLPKPLAVLADILDPPNKKDWDLAGKSLSGLKQLMGSTYQEPQTTPGKVADFALQNVIFGAKKPKDLLNLPQTLRNLIAGTAGGAAGELVPEDMPKIKMAAQMIGGFTPLAVETALKSPNRATKNAAAMIKQAMAGKTDAEWKQADELLAKSHAVGVPLAGPEAFKGGSQIQQLASDVAASPAAGAKLREFTAPRADQVQASVKQHLQNVGHDIGGQEAANQMESAGTKVIQKAEQGRSAATSKFYDAAKIDRVPDESINAVLSNVDAAIAADKTNILAPKLREFRKTLMEEQGQAATGPTRTVKQTLRGQIASTKPGTEAIPPKPITDIENLDRARKYFRDKIELPAMSADAMPKEVSKAISPYLSAIRTEMEGASENYQRGKALHQAISEKRVDPLMKGPVGKVAGKGADAQREASYVRVMSELGSETATPDRIRTLAKESSKIDKEAFPDVTRAYLEARLNTSLKDLQGRRNPMAGSNFRNAIAGTPKDRANLHAMLEESARIQGQDPKNVATGFDNLLDVLDATGRVPGMGSQTQSRMENAAMARSNPVSGAVEAVSTTPTKRISKWLDDMMYKGTYSKLAEVFTAPDSVKRMKELANLKPTSTEARNLVSLMLTSASQSANDDKSDDDKRKGQRNDQ